MKATCAILFILLLVTLAQAQQKWIRTYGGTLSDEGYSGQQTSDGGYIVAGYTRSFGAGSADFWLIKTNPSGDTLWTRTYGGTSDEYGSSVQQTSDGGYIVTGYTRSFGDSTQVYLIKTNASGDTLWTRTYGGTRWDQGNFVQQTSDMDYIIAGTTNSFGAGNKDIYLIKTNASGDTLWTRTYGGTRDEYTYSVQQTSDGGYIVSGTTYSFGAGSYDAYLIKTNASGDTLWTRTYGGGGDDAGTSVRQTQDGGYIVAGYTSSYGAGGADVWLIKTNASGDTLWTRTCGGTSGDYVYSVQQTSDGGYIISGSTNSFGAGNYDVYLIKTDGNGNVGVETPVRQFAGSMVRQLKAIPNPFVSYASVPGHEAERFALYDISGKRVGVYRGDRIGEGLTPGVYFLRPSAMNARPARVVKLR